MSLKLGDSASTQGTVAVTFAQSLDPEVRTTKRNRNSSRECEATMKSSGGFGSIVEGFRPAPGGGNREGVPPRRQSGMCTVPHGRSTGPTCWRRVGRHERRTFCSALLCRANRPVRPCGHRGDDASREGAGLRASLGLRVGNKPSEISEMARNGAVRPISRSAVHRSWECRTEEAPAATHQFPRERVNQGLPGLERDDLVVEFQRWPEATEVKSRSASVARRNDTHG